MCRLLPICVICQADAAETLPVAQPLPENIQQGLSASVKYLVGNFLEEKHYSKISANLASKWDKFQSLTAAMRFECVW